MRIYMRQVIYRSYPLQPQEVALSLVQFKARVVILRVGMGWGKPSGISYRSTNNAGLILMIDLNGNVLSSFNAPYKNSIGPLPSGLAYDGTISGVWIF